MIMMERKDVKTDDDISARRCPLLHKAWPSWAMPVALSERWLLVSVVCGCQNLSEHANYKQKPDGCLYVHLTDVQAELGMCVCRGGGVCSSAQGSLRRGVEGIMWRGIVSDT